MAFSNLTDGASSVDKMNGVGMPLLFLSVMAVTIFMTRPLLQVAVTLALTDTTSCLCLVAALANMALSVFLFFTTAFNYGLVSTVLAYCVVFLNGRESFRHYLVHLLAIYLLWFLVLVGVPAELNHGIIRATNSGDCVAFYGTYASTMCVDGWLAFVKVVACFVLGFTLLSLLLLVTEVLGSERLSVARTQSPGGEDSKVPTGGGRE
ncbi:uncharacterized protein Tco025E_04172 [Trypanosoma conorhini]|uniref:Uncharacterized protein n=1 Tax=Trypanosoma conorhini TaxID=83891 RepID=A0A3R7L480_9TRYP|nr:uncharacterized protein Tco025E_04172 [Trypanosoma conorhini]RNF19361.1 hypothetical protein Tco025E_04172 [Trypanosoma conorhini]